MSEMMQLNQSELSEFSRCEAVIARGIETFYEVGKALLEIRDKRLYRESYKTFEDYCRERWSMGRNYTNKLIAATDIVANLGTTVPKPTHESQVRPLASLEPVEQQAVWTQAVAESNGQPTAAKVEEVKRTFFQVLKERIKARGSGSVSAISAEDRTEIKEIRERMRVNSERVSKIMHFVEAIEVFSKPAIPIPEVAAEIRGMDTPDKDWRGQAITAEEHLTQLLEELRQ